MHILITLLSVIYFVIGSKNGTENDELEVENEEGKPTCDAGWVPFAPPGGGKYTYCLKAFTTFRMSWQQAEESCTQFGSNAHLVSIRTVEQAGWLNKIIPETYKQSLNFKSYRWIDSGWWIGLGQMCPNSQLDQIPTLRWTDGNMFDNKKATVVGNLKLIVPKRNKWDGHYCVSYHYEKFANGTGNEEFFNLTECTERRNFVCQTIAFSQDRNADGKIFAKEKLKDEEDYGSELTEEFPCGKDPFYCPLKTTDGTTCYHLHSELQYWEQAGEECNVHYQSDLTSMHSKEEVDFIYQMVQMQPSVSGETKYWIGLHRRNAQRLDFGREKEKSNYNGSDYSQYEWSDGSSFDYMVPLVASEDLDEENGACAAIQFNVSTRSLLLAPIYRIFGIPIPPQKKLPAYAWIHQRCDNKHLAICRKPGFDYKQPHLRSAKEERKMKKHKSWKCSDGYNLFRGMCYKVFGTKDEGVAFSEAVQRCKNEKASLVSITDIYENGFVVSLLQKLNGKAWIGMDMSEGRVRWLDGEPLKMIKFSPDNRIIRIGGDRHVFQNTAYAGFSHQACVAMNAVDMVGYWDVIFNTTDRGNSEKQILNVTNFCETTKLPYICESYAEESSNSRLMKVCHNIDDVIYCFLANDPSKNLNGFYSFMDASEICATLPKLEQYKNFSTYYGQLAQADNIFEWSFLTATALDNNYDEFFVGVRYKKSIGFERMDKLRLHLTPWGVGEPKLKNGNCVVLKISKDGPAWYMEDCEKQKQIVCKLTKEQPMSEIPQKVRCPNGKEDWILGKTQCYYLVTNASLISSGYKADHDCFKYFGANLASFETREDFEQFKSHVLHNQLTVSSAIIGLIRQQHGSYAWKDLSPVTFLNWAEDEPADVKGRVSQECVQMQLSGNYSWNSVTCWQSRHFVCSVPVVDAYEESNTENDRSDFLPPPPTNEKKEKGYEDEKTKKEFGGSNLRQKARNKNELAASPSSSSSTTTSSNSFGTVVGICILLIAAVLTISIAYIWRQKQSLKLGDRRIIQFDSLQNEEEIGI